MYIKFQSSLSLSRVSCNSSCASVPLPYMSFSSSAPFTSSSYNPPSTHKTSHKFSELFQTTIIAASVDTREPPSPPPPVISVEFHFLCTIIWTFAETFARATCTEYEMANWNRFERLAVILVEWFNRRGQVSRSRRTQVDVRGSP